MFLFKRENVTYQTIALCDEDVVVTIIGIRLQTEKTTVNIKPEIGP